MLLGAFLLYGPVPLEAPGRGPLFSFCFLFVVPGPSVFLCFIFVGPVPLEATGGAFVFLLFPFCSTGAPGGPWRGPSFSFCFLSWDQVLVIPGFLF